MEAVPEDIQVLFGDINDQANSDGTSEASTASSESIAIDYHREQYPAYQPPHMRGHNVQQDKYVNFKNRDPKKGPDPDKIEGVDNDKYQRLKLPVPFALDRIKLAKLKGEFPGVYFHVKDNNNHDHQFSHVVTMIGTRMCQRMIKPGSRVLDVYGNANACDRFNGTQVAAANPKSMKALHLRVGPSDFIREVNKWGPYADEEGVERYHRGTLQDMINTGDIYEYNVLQFIHTLYYEDFNVLARALHAPCANGKKRVAYGLVHRHSSEEGSLNDGEQTYIKKTAMNGSRLVKQTNVITRSEYIHPDLTPLLFRADKTWFPPQGNQGITWECHMVNSETWIIEIVAYELCEMRDDVVDYTALWDMEEDDYIGRPIVATPLVEQREDCVIIPTEDGKFVKAQITNHKLFATLRQACAGKERNRALLDEIIRLAKHHIAPSGMFGDKQGMLCQEEHIIDHAMAAYFVDLEHEQKLLQTMSVLRPVLVSHTSKLNLGPKFREYSINDFVNVLRAATQVGRHLNAVRRSKDPIDKGLELLGNQLG
jgi:hypothetical protein